MTAPRTVRTAVVSLLALVVSSLAAVTVADSPAAAAPARITLDGPARAVLHGFITLGGQLRGRERPVLAQELRRGRWVTVERSSAFNGGYETYVRTTRTGPVRYRVLAPAVRRGGRPLARSVSRTIVVRVAAERVTWRLPRQARIGDEVDVPVTVRPTTGLTGITLQQEVNGRWQRVTSTHQRKRGATLTYTQITRGPSRFRIVLGSSGKITEPRTVTGTPDDEVLPTRRVSTSSNGSQADGGSGQASTSDDGRYVVLVSTSRSLVPRENDRWDDVFLKDTATGKIIEVTRGADGDSRTPVISGDGRWVVFVSRAGNLVRADGDRRPDVFVWDRTTGTTTRVGRGAAGASYGVTAARPAISADGRWIAFASKVDGLVAGDTNGRADVFLRDRSTGSLTRVSQPPTGARGNGDSITPSISADGRYVAFGTRATDLTADGVAGVLRWDRTTGESEVVSRGRVYRPVISADGSVVAHDADDVPGADGHRQVVVRDLDAGTTSVVSTRAGLPGEGESYVADVTADGTRVLFTSTAPLVDGDVDSESCESEASCYASSSPYDVFLAEAGTVSLVSRAADGRVSEFFSEGFELLPDGSGVLFGSDDHLVPGMVARDLVFDDGYGYGDVFVRDLG